MNQQQIIQFRSEYASIVYHKGELKSNQQHLSSLHRWDKNDSHKKAILRTLELRDEITARLNKKLKGRTYEQWKEFSSHLAKLQNRLRYAKKEPTIKALQNQIDNLAFEL